MLPMEKLSPAAVVVAVAHDAYKEFSPEAFRGMMNENPVLVDVKGIYKRDILEMAEIRVWRL